MRKNTPVTVRLEPEERARLEAESRRRGVGAAELAREYVLAGLDRAPADAEERQRRTLEALDRLARLTEGLPPVDAVRIARQSRDELSERPRL